MLIQPYNKSQQKFNEEHTVFLWRSIKWSIHWFNSKVNGARSKIEQEYLLHLVTKKFVSFFGDELWWSELNRFQMALKSWQWEVASNIIDELTATKWWNMQSDMKEWMESFALFFNNHAGLIQTYHANGAWSKMPDAFNSSVDSNDLEGNKRYIEARARKQVREKQIREDAKNKELGKW